MTRAQEGPTPGKAGMPRARDGPQARTRRGGTLKERTGLMTKKEKGRVERERARRTIGKVGRPREKVQTMTAPGTQRARAGTTRTARPGGPRTKPGVKTGRVGKTKAAG